jgi:hypothetical protein
MKSKAFLLISVLLLLGLTFPGLGASEVEYLSDEMACIKLAGNFMQDIVSGEIDNAFARIRPYFPMPAGEFESLVSRTKNQLKGNERELGSILGYEFVKEERVEDFLIRFTFVIKHDVTVTRWRFLYYKPEDGWMLNSFFWDNQVKGLFDSPD